MRLGLSSIVTDFCTGGEIVAKVQSSAHGYPASLAPFIEETVLFLMFVFNTFVEDHLAIDAWVNFWDLCCFYWCMCHFYANAMLFLSPWLYSMY
jgi:hypothetical protein